MTPEDPSRLPGARRREAPGKIKPQLATPAERAPAGGEWLNEIKYDGYRSLAVVRDGSVRIYSRNGHDWTSRYGAIAREIESADLGQAILDGEIVVLQPDGATDFQTLQNVLKGVRKGVLTYCVFDLLYYRGYDLTGTPLQERKALLQRLLSARSDWRFLRYSDHLAGRAPAFFREACRHALEGIIAKRADAGYEQRRTRSWLKIKCRHRQEFVVGGFSEPSGSRHGFGALLLGYYDDAGRLVYAGRVGTGFDRQTLQTLRDRLDRRRRPTAPFSPAPAGPEARDVHWTRPDLVAEVDFAAWTRDGRLRQASFKGLREDKPASSVFRETPVSRPDPTPPPEAGNRSGPPEGPLQRRGKAPSPPEEDGSLAGVPLSNPDKILYPDPGIRKEELARFYADTAGWILPHIVERPLMLLRCPHGHGGACFYQKHASGALPAQMRGVPIQEKRKRRDYFYIEDLSGLIAAVQMGSLEIHPWGCRVDRIERPDRMVFDLDPGQGATWESLVAAAHLVRAFLQELGLQSFVKTSGGKGLHVMVPLTRRNSWDDVRSFSENVAHALVRHFPDRYLATMTKSRRKGKVFIDYFRNNRGATTVATYSTRALPGAPVSTPLAWDALDKDSGPRIYDVRSLPRRLESLGADPWAGFFDIRQSLTRATQRQAAAMRSGPPG